MAMAYIANNMGNTILISASTAYECKAGARVYIAKGAKLISPPGRVGAKWLCTVENIKADVAEVIEMSGRRIIRAKTESAVKAKLLDLVQKGANIVEPAHQVTGGDWIAVCDHTAEVYKW
jgi:hypothetical protein